MKPSPMQAKGLQLDRLVGILKQAASLLLAARRRAAAHTMRGVSAPCAAGVLATLGVIAVFVARAPPPSSLPALAASPASAASGAASAGVVHTACGAMQGARLEGAERVWAWRGITYAHAERWAPPTPSACDPAAALDARACAADCVHIDPFGGGGMVGEEACLTLTVLAHEDALAPGAPPLPILFAPSNGGLAHGSACDSTFYGAPLVHWAAEARAVVVLAAFRLGPLGFLYLEAEGAEGEGAADAGLPRGTANNGLRDVVEALRWVRAHGRAFGGDIASVTVVGQSSGGTVGAALLMSPLASGLFHRAWLSSPSVAFGTRREASAGWWRALGVGESAAAWRAANCSTDARAVARCLRELPARDVYLAFDAYAVQGESQFEVPTRPTAAGPNIFPVFADGEVIALSPSRVRDAPPSLLAQLPAARAGAVVGAAREEIEVLYPGPPPSLQPFDEAHVRAWAAALAPEDAGLGARVWRAYEPTADTAAPQRLLQLGSDLRFVCAARQFALDLAAARRAGQEAAPVYSYVLTHALASPLPPLAPPPAPPLSHAFHGLDYYVLLGNAMGAPLGRADEEVGSRLRGAFVAFVTSGSVPSWAQAADNATCDVGTLADACSASVKAAECAAIREGGAADAWACAF